MRTMSRAARCTSGADAQRSASRFFSSIQISIASDSASSSDVTLQPFHVLFLFRQPIAPGDESGGQVTCQGTARRWAELSGLEGAAFDAALREAVDRYAPDLVVLAGFMRLLGPAFIDHHSGRLLNIHPSLLPAFPGLRTHARALAAGATVHGATVHFVTRETDAGPIVIQAAVPVRRGDTPDVLSARVLKEEHRIYPLAIRWFAEGRLKLAGDRVLLDGAPRADQDLTSAPE